MDRPVAATHFDDECLCGHRADQHAVSSRSECLADDCDCAGFAWSDEDGTVWVI